MASEVDTELSEKDEQHISDLLRSGQLDKLI